MTERSNEEQGSTKEKFRIGGRDEVIYLLHRRGDASQEISERYGVKLEDVEAAISRCRARERRESGKKVSE
jgi:DNA-directed RNA polymerase specialized sigma24 family protein